MHSRDKMHSIQKVDGGKAW